MSIWNLMAQGAYNSVYLSEDGKWVLKIQKYKSDETDAPQRSIRLWKAINPQLPAYLVDTPVGGGWVCPYIKGSTPTDEDISRALITIYNRTGRIIVDATAHKNFIKMDDDEVVCIDVGMALNFENREETFFHEPIRRKSIISLSAWNELSTEYIGFFQTEEARQPISIQTVKALIFIKRNRPNTTNLDFLKGEFMLISKLANAYENVDVEGALKALDSHVHCEFHPLFRAILEDFDGYRPSDEIYHWFRHQEPEDASKGLKGSF